MRPIEYKSGTASLLLDTDDRRVTFTIRDDGPVPLVLTISFEAAEAQSINIALDKLVWLASAPQVDLD